MATTKRRSKRRVTRRKHVNPVAAKPRRRRSATVRSRAHNPTFRRRRRSAQRHRNPGSGGLLTRGLALAGSAAVLQVALGFVPPIGGVSPLADAGRTALVGWGVSTLMTKFRVLPGYAQDMALAGFTLAGGKLISSFILPFATRFFAPTPAPQPAENGQGVSGIAPYYPGMQPYSEYGLAGIAPWAPGQQPFNKYAPIVV